MKTMKLTYLFIFAMFFITSCSSDDATSEEETATAEPTLIGEWIGVTSTYNGIDFGDPEKNIIVFSEDNTAKFTYLEFGDNGEDVIREANYEQLDNVLTVDWQGNFKDMETMTLTVTTLTKDTLVIEYNITLDGVITETYTRL